MFKDIYKQANDRIDESSAKSRVIAKLNKPVPVRRVKSGARIAAIAACFVLTIAVAGVYGRMHKDTALPTPGEMVRTADFSQDAETKTGLAMTDASGLVVNQGLDDTNFALAAYSEPGENEREVSALEYCEYLGKNIPMIASVLGMTDDTPKTQVLGIGDSGEYTDDSYEFMLTDGDKSYKIETTKNTDEITEKIENPDRTKCQIGGMDAVVMAEDGVMKAYFVSDGIGYTIIAFGCEADELENLILALN